MNRRPPYQPSTHPQRLHAELRWLTHSPDLLNPPPTLVRPSLLDRWSDTMPLDTSLYQPCWRLGEHFENIVHQLLKSNRYIFDIKRNVQVISDKKTLGEFDFLFKIQQQWIHLEVALKLYLLDGEGRALTDYVGTRRDDRLADKWHRLLGHQLTLAQRPEAKARLLELGIDQPVRSSLWLKGWLFYHPSRTVLGEQPAEINPQHLKGWWLTYSELALLNKPDVAFMLARKPDWLLPPSMLETPALDFEHLQHSLQGEVGANLVLVVSKTADGWMELSRGFVVADNWPQQR